MKVVRILFFVSLQFVVPFEAQAVVFGQERGAGHEVALAFRKAFEVALKDLQRKGFSREDHDKLLATANGAKYLVVEGPLYVSTADGVQVATAVNDVKAQSISIDFKRWDGITDAQIASALALHEVASLAGLEGTGKYTLSAAYICEDKLSPPTNVQDPRLKDFVNNYRDELGKVLDSAQISPAALLSATVTRMHQVSADSVPLTLVKRLGWYPEARKSWYHVLIPGGVTNPADFIFIDGRTNKIVRPKLWRTYEMEDGRRVSFSEDDGYDGFEGRWLEHRDAMWEVMQGLSKPERNLREEMEQRNALLRPYRTAIHNLIDGGILPTDGWSEIRNRQIWTPMFLSSTS